MRDGRRIQLQLYAIAAREQLGAERLVARYAYLSPGSDWFLDTSDAEDAALIERVAGEADGVRRAVEGGDFRVNAQAALCSSYCDFRHMCRVNQFTRHKWSS